MKKILLTIGITLLIFQMVVLAVDIDIGAAAINRSFSGGGDITLVNKTNPANDSGIIDTIEMWINTQIVNCEVATFYVVSGNNLSTRDTHAIGTVTAGSKQTFTGLNISVQAGDYIGIRFSSGYIEKDNSGGDGLWSVEGDKIPCTNVSFSLGEGNIISLYGTGTTEAAEEEGNAIFFGTNL